VPFGAPDEIVTTEIDARDHLDAKIAAMRAHRTQIQVDGPFFALSNNAGQRAFGREFYILAAGPGAAGGPGSRGGDGARETDLFAGIDL
jgi:N-acetyl-1-D-myo-inositol-2-amino-2-deoxy-alpha-D-glucopyranoside deacetylase